MAKTGDNDMTEGQEALISQIAWKVGDAIQVRIEKRIDEKILLHDMSCATRKTLEALTNQAKGGSRVVAMIVSVAGGLAGAAAAIWTALTK